MPSLLANNLTATLDSTGKLTISTTNDYASSTLGSAVAGGAIGGTLTSSITFTTASAPVVDASAQAVRSNLVNQFNGILSQITTTSQDASFNGVNLLGGDQLKLTFNETGKSTLNITGVIVQCGGPRSGEPDERYRLHRQLRHQQGHCQPEQRLDPAAHAGLRLGFEPVDRADPSGLLEEPDQRAADRLVEPDAGRHQRGSGEQPGAVDPPVDRGVRAGAGQPVASRACCSCSAKRDGDVNDQGGGENPAATIELKFLKTGWRRVRRIFIRTMFRKRREPLCSRVFGRGTIVPLRVELKPFERIVIGETVLVNSGTRTSFLIDGDAPILREKDTITAETANTPAKRLYLCLQTMYLKNDIPRYRTAYQGFLRELRDANPGAQLTIDAANNHVSAGALYKALKEIRKLVKREDELLAA